MIATHACLKSYFTHMRCVQESHELARLNLSITKPTTCHMIGVYSKRMNRSTLNILRIALKG